MYVVIPVANEPENPTLKLAIASIRAHTDFDVVTIGHDHGLAEHIPTVQQPGQPFANTDLAMRVACERLERFIWSADDIYWMRPAEPVRWALGQLGRTLNRGVYGRRKATTRDWLQAHGLPTWDYESHTPMPIQADAMLETLEHIKREPALDKRTVYGNLTGEPDVIAEDVKVRERATVIPDAPWVSDHDHSPISDQLRAHVTERLGAHNASV